MDEKTVQSAMEIILNAGDARLKNKEALEAVAQGDLAAAHEKMAEAHAKITEAHRVQTDAIQGEAAGEKMEYSLLFTHAQDTLMTTYSELRLARRLLPVFRTLDDRIRALDAKNHD